MTKIYNVDVKFSKNIDNVVIDEIWYGYDNIYFGSKLKDILKENTISLVSFNEFNSEEENNGMMNFIIMMNSEFFIIDSDNKKYKMDLIGTFYDIEDEVLGPVLGFIFEVENFNLKLNEKYTFEVINKSQKSISLPENLFLLKNK
jgi:hypothetical protein